jgi:hypothetical protein
MTFSEGFEIGQDDRHTQPPATSNWRAPYCSPTSFVMSMHSILEALIAVIFVFMMCSITAEAVQKLQREVAAESESVSREWKAPLLFKVQNDYSLQWEEMDIFELSDMKYKSRIFHFSPVDYPPDKQGLDKLKKDIQRQARSDCGAKLVSNGGGSHSSDKSKQG